MEKKKNISTKGGASTEDAHRSAEIAHTSEAPLPTAPAKSTPLPFAMMSILAFVLLTESLCSTMLIPFVGLYVAFLQGVKPEEAGKTSGILISLFMLGQVLSGKFWGYVSDTYGRRVPLLVGLAFSGGAMFFFGLAPNIYVCCVLRFLHGAFNGVVLCAKTIIVDITDKTNEAKGFAMVSITWSLGTLFGQAIGGFLYSPSQNPKWAWANISPDSFLGRNPAFLPSCVITVYTFVVFIGCFFALPETNKHCKPLTESALVRNVLKLLGRGPATDSGSGGHTTALDAPVVVSVELETAPAAANAPGDSNGHEARPETDTAKPPVHNNLSYVAALRIPELRNVTIFYCMLAASDMMFIEILPLWGVARTSVNGLGYYSDSVSMIILSYSIPALVANIYFSQVLKIIRHALLLLWNFSSVLTVITTFGFPFAVYMGMTTGFCYLLVLGIVRQVGVSWCYSLVHLMTAKAAPVGGVGAAYAVSQSLASSVRCLVPPIISPLFAWSIAEKRDFPFNHFLCFLFSIVPMIVSVVMTTKARIVSDNKDPREAEENQLSGADAYNATHTPRAAATVSHNSSFSGGGARRSCDGSFSAESNQGEPSMLASLIGSFAGNPVGDMPFEDPMLMLEAEVNVDVSPSGGSRSAGRPLSVDHLLLEEDRVTASGKYDPVDEELPISDPDPHQEKP